MFFSIPIPIYNTEKYIEECLASVLCQTETDFEIILLDDGSTDQSGYICDAYAERYPFVRVIHKKNEGLLMTRRRGFGAAFGDYFICLDSDDYWLDKEMLYKIRRMIETEHCDMVLWDYIYGARPDKPEKRIALFDYPDGYVFSGKKKEELYKKLLIGGNLNAIWAKAYKREIVDIDTDYSPWQPDICRGEDVFQSFPLLTNATRIGYLKEPFNYYRQVPTAISYNPKLRFYNAYRRIYLRENEYLDKWNVDTDLYNASLKKRVPMITGIITTGCARSKTKEQKKEWYCWARDIGKDSFFTELNRTAQHSNVLLYYKVICFLIKHQMPHLAAFTIKTTNRISAIRHRGDNNHASA